MEKDIEVLKWQHFIEYGLIYVWILKDYAWSSNSYYMGAIFGTTAVVWAIALATFSFYRGDHEDLFMNCIMTIWLSGNYVWMSGELTLTNSDNGIPFWGNNSQNTQVALDCFITALSLLSLYYLVLKPLEVFTLDPVSVELERQEGLAARFPSYFKTLRQYEYLHMYFWIGKDLSWNLLTPIPWLIFFFFTFAIGIDFVIITYRRGLWKDFAHVVAQFFWVLGNFAWGYGEQFDATKDAPIPIGLHNQLAIETGRWWCQVILVVAYQPLALFYVYLLYMYYYNPASEGIMSRKNSIVDNPLQISESFMKPRDNSVLGRNRNSIQRQTNDSMSESPRRISISNDSSVREKESDEIMTRRRGTCIIAGDPDTVARSRGGSDAVKIRSRGNSDAMPPVCPLSKLASPENEGGVSNL